MAFTGGEKYGNSYATHEAPSTWQRRTSYTAANLPEYIGFAPVGVASSADGWTIYKITYSSSLETLKQTAFGAWDDKTALSYS